MEFFSFSPMETAVLTLVVVGMMFVLFLREAFPTEVVAIAGAALLRERPRPTRNPQWRG